MTEVEDRTQKYYEAVRARGRAERRLAKHDQERARAEIDVKLARNAEERALAQMQRAIAARVGGELDAEDGPPEIPPMPAEAVSPEVFRLSADSAVFHQVAAQVERARGATEDSEPTPIDPDEMPF